MHQSCREATGYGLGLGALAKKVRCYCPGDAISCCMCRKSEVLQQPMPSYNHYRGITCLILMLLKKLSQSINGAYMTSPYKKTSHVVIINFGLKFR